MSDAINDFLGYVPDILPDFFESLRNGLLGITELIVIVENGLAMIQWNHWLRISVFILIELLLLVTVL